MRHLLRLSDLTKEEAVQIFHIADEMKHGKYKNYLKGQTVVMFFPASSIRTRVTFEKGIYLLGGQSILFPSDSLDKKEEIHDVTGYLNNWADVVIVRHKDIFMLDRMKDNAKMPVINAMTDRNHPCEMMADMYSLSKIRNSFVNDKYLFVGAAGNIGYAWKEASELMGFSLEQCCPAGYEIEGLVTNKNAVLNPCPPFYRGEEVANDVIDSSYFVGYNFKKSLLEIQQAIIIFLMNKRS